MNSLALCLCLTPVVFPEDTSALLAASSNNGKDRCLAILINQRQDLFNGLPMLDESSNAYRSLRPASMINLDDDDGDPAWRNSQDDLRFTHPLSAVSVVDGMAVASVQPRPGSPWHRTDIAMERRHHGHSTDYSSDFDGQHEVIASHFDHPPMQYSASEVSYISPPISRSGSLIPPISPGQDEHASALLWETSEPLSPGINVGLRAMSPNPTESQSPSNAGSGTASPHRSFSQRARSGSQSIANAVRSTLTGRTRSPAPTTQPAFIGPTHGARQQSGPLSPPLLQTHHPTLVSPLRETVSPYLEEELAAACIADTQRSSPWSPPRPPSRLSSDGGRSAGHATASAHQHSQSNLDGNLPLGAVRISSRPTSRGLD